MRLVSVVTKLARDSEHLIARHASDFFLPSRGVGRISVVATVQRLAFQTTQHAILGHLQVKHRGDHNFARNSVAFECQVRDWHAAQHDVTAELFVGGEIRRGHTTEIRERHIGNSVRLRAIFDHRQLERRLVRSTCVLALEVPLAQVGTLVIAPAKANRAGRQSDFAVEAIGHCLPVGVVGLAELVREVAGAHIATWHHHLAAIGQGFFFHHHQQRQVGVAARVVVKVGRAFLEIELFQNHMAHGHGHSSIGALLGVHPQVSQLGNFGVVGRDRHGFAALVAHFGEKVGVRGARLRHVRAPSDDEGRVVPIGRLGHVGLLTPHLGAGRRQVAIPVVKTQADAANQA